MNHLKLAAAALALFFISIWGITAAFSIKFSDVPAMAGPALGFTLLAGGIAALFGAIWCAAVACDGEDE